MYRISPSAAIIFWFRQNRWISVKLRKVQVKALTSCILMQQRIEHRDDRRWQTGKIILADCSLCTLNDIYTLSILSMRCLLNSGIGMDHPLLSYNADFIPITASYLGLSFCILINKMDQETFSGTEIKQHGIFHFIHSNCASPQVLFFCNSIW